MASLMPLAWIEWAFLLILLGAYWSFSASSLGLSRRRALVTSGMVLGLTLLAWLDLLYFHQFPGGIQSLNKLFGAQVFLLDTLNTPILVLTALLNLALITITLKTRLNRFSFSRTLLLEAAMLATLSTHHVWVLVFMYSLMIMPLIDEFHQRGHSARVLTLHIGTAALCLLLGLSLQGHSQTEMLSTMLIAIGVGIQCGLVPAHCWVIDVFDKAAFGTALIFFTPLTGIYLASRFLIGHAPQGVLYALATLALISAFYNAAMAGQQKESRAFVCYFILSQMGLVLAGLLFPNALGITASMFLWFSMPMALMGIGLTLRSLEARAGRLSLEVFHGFHSQTPTLSAIFLVMGLAAIGFPGTLGFFGVEMLTDAAIQASKLWGFCVIGTAALNGIAVFRVYSQIFFGKESHSEVNLGIRKVELAGFMVLVILVIGGTLWPQPNLNSRNHAALQIYLSRHPLSHAALK